MPTDEKPLTRAQLFDEMPTPKHPGVWLCIPFVAAALILAALWFFGGLPT